MQCTSTREQLLEPIAQAEKVTGKNLTLPILSCVLLCVRGTTLTVVATNLEVGVEFSLSVADAEDGAVAVSGSILSHVLSSLIAAARVTLRVESGYLLIESAGATSRIALQDAQEFPTLPRVSDGATYTLPSKELRDVLTSVAYCASTSTIKPELASVFVHPEGAMLVSAATDSFRLAEKRVALKEPVSGEPFLVPARSVGELVRILERAKDGVELNVSAHQFSLTLPGVYFTLRLTTGIFPDYTQIIPKEYVAEANMLLFDIERVLRKAAVFGDQFNQTTITIHPKKKEFIVHTENATVGETTDTVPAGLSGSDLTIKFNQRYLIDAFVPMKSESICMQFAGQAQPAIIRPVGDDSFRYLVMPMNR